MRFTEPKRLAAAFDRLAAAASRVPNEPAYAAQKVLLVYRLQVAFEALYRCGRPAGNPVPAMTALVNRGTTVLRGMAALRLPRDPAAPRTVADATRTRRGRARFGQVTELYGGLFAAFDRRHYFDEAYAMLRQRLTRNRVDLRWFRGKKVLDAGCGGGRYTCALARLGCASVTGIDGSATGIAVARERLRQFPLRRRVRYRQGDLLHLPFADRSFDFVFSNGVLHHTYDMRRGLREVRRVLRDDGRAWLYVYGNYGLEWWAIEQLFRVIAAIPDDFVRDTLLLTGLPGHRVFYFLDRFSPAIKRHYTAVELERLLAAEGFTVVRRLRRGVDADLNEYLRRGNRFAPYLYGDGDLRYLIAKQHE